MKRLGIGNIEVSRPQGEAFSETAQRLIQFECSEAQAFALAQHLALKSTSSDREVEVAVISALIAAKQAVDEEIEVEYVAGRRCDLQRRLEGRA